MPKTKVAICGGGIAGLSCAKMLQEAGIAAIIFEKEERPGGLCRSADFEGRTFDLHGGHIFNSKFAEVRDWVFKLLPRENWQETVRNSKILHRDRWISYPFELALGELPDEDCIECLVDFVTPRSGPQPDNFEDWVVWFFGKGIAERYMLPYNRKIWRVDLRDVGVSWIAGKMPQPTIREVVAAAIRKQAAEQSMPHWRFYYPLKGGIETLIRAIAAPLEDVRCMTPVERIARNGDLWAVNDVGGFSDVVSTIPLDWLRSVCEGVAPQIADMLASLRHNTVRSAFVVQPRNDFSWAYVPDPAYETHRLVEQGNLSPGCCPPSETTTALETTGEAAPPSLFEEFRKDDRGLRELKMVRYLGQAVTPYAYPIFDHAYCRNIAAIHSYFAGKGLHLLGRFGEWQYYNMDVCIKRAMETASAILAGTRVRKASRGT